MIRCSRGTFQDKFTYINLYPDGEIIGSDSQTCTLVLDDPEEKIDP